MDFQSLILPKLARTERRPFEARNENEYYERAAHVPRLIGAGMEAFWWAVTGLNAFRRMGRRPIVWLRLRKVGTG